MSDLSWVGSQLASRKPGHCLPRGLYVDPRAHEFDLEAIHARSWLMAGLECEVPTPGSYLALNLGEWPVLIVRDRAGTIRAFHNACRHRGSILCEAGHGSAPRLVCPYHRWTYDLNGSLLAAGRMADDFDKKDYPLKPIALKRVAGAMFICLSDDPPEFDEFAARFAEYAGPMNFTDLKLAATDLMVEQANWKLVMENGRECYHCPTGHPELATSFPVHMKRHFDEDPAKDTLSFAERMDVLELPNKAIEGDWWQLARFALNPGTTSISMDGQAVCRKPLVAFGDESIGSLRWALDPHLFAHAAADHVFVFSAMPVSPRETHVYSRWYVHKDAVEGEDYEVEAMKELWVKTNLQDRTLAENNHKGVLSPAFEPGPFSPEAEALALRFTNWYCDTARAYVAAHG